MLKQIIGKVKSTLNAKWKLFGTLNGLIAFYYGIFGSTVSFAATHFRFYLIAPLLTYLLLGYAWKWTFKKEGDFAISYLIALVLVLVPIIHYLSYLVLIYFNLIAENIDPTEYSTYNTSGDFLYFFVAAFAFTVGSIYELYFTTLLIPIAIGVLVHRKGPNRT